LWPADFIPKRNPNVVTSDRLDHGYLFVGGHTNALSLDPFGNLWVGDDPSDGAFNFSGRLWRIPAAKLATIP